MRNYFGCNKCNHCFFKGFLRKKDNKILRSPKTKEERAAMKWWLGWDETAMPLQEAIDDGMMESWCDECNAFVNSVMPQTIDLITK